MLDKIKIPCISIHTCSLLVLYTYRKIGSPVSWFIVIFIYKSNWTYYEWKLYWIRQRYMICARPSPHPYAYIWIILQSVLQYVTVRHIIMCWDFHMDWQDIRQLYPSLLLQTSMAAKNSELDTGNWYVYCAIYYI